MLAPVQHLLAKKRIILASASPRRQELLQALGLNIEIYPSSFEEQEPQQHYQELKDHTEATAWGKAKDISQRVQNEDPQADYLLIAADTMVTIDNKRFGKPKDKEDAFYMLRELSGRPSGVSTSVALLTPKSSSVFTETAKVYFGKLTDEQIRAYVDSGHPMDKAGAYGIQGQGGALIERIDGDFYTIMGLPLHRTCCEIIQLLQKEAVET